MSQPALKCENNAILGKSTGTLTLFIAFKMAHSLLFQHRGNLYFLDFLQKSFITSTTVCFSLNDDKTANDQ